MSCGPFSVYDKDWVKFPLWEKTSPFSDNLNTDLKCKLFMAGSQTDLINSHTMTEEQSSQFKLTEFLHYV